MSRIVTLPITPISDASFLTLITPLFADVISKAMGGNLGIVINTVGMKSHGNSVNIFNKYASEIASIGIGIESLFHDGDDAYEGSFQQTFQRLATTGHIVSRAQFIMWCSCGKVEVPKEVLVNLIDEQRKKTLIKGETIETTTCSKCFELLKCSYENVLAMQLTAAQPDAVYPKIYEAELKRISMRISENPTIISRNHRKTTTMVKFENLHFGIDTDFRWISYLECLFGLEEEIIIVSSPTTLNQAVKVVTLSKILNPARIVKLVIHPLVRIEGASSELKRMKLEEFLNIYKSAQARMFLSVGFGWSAYESILTTDLMFLVNKTIESRSNVIGPSGLKELRNLPQILNKTAILGAFKTLRAGRDLTEDQRVIMRCINPLE